MHTSKGENIHEEHYSLFLECLEKILQQKKEKLFHLNSSFRETGVGMWYIFADYPAGPSANYSIFELEEMKHTPLHQFKDNVAHSNGQAGLALFKRLGPNHEILPCSTYAPNYNPTDLKGGPPFAPVDFDPHLNLGIVARPK